MKNTDRENIRNYYITIYQMSELVRPENQIVDTKQFHLSTRGDAGTVINGDYKSQILFNIPDAIVIDDSIDYIHFSVPYAVIPNSFLRASFKLLICTWSFLNAGILK